LQSCDAARALLLICVDSLYPGGALPYLPSRFLLWFTYGALVLLKVKPRLARSAIADYDRPFILEPYFERIMSSKLDEVLTGFADHAGRSV